MSHNAAFRHHRPMLSHLLVGYWRVVRLHASSESIPMYYATNDDVAMVTCVYWFVWKISVWNVMLISHRRQLV
jgi:hypothetical protein